jgi:hypothetical protein
VSWRDVFVKDIHEAIKKGVTRESEFPVLLGRQASSQPAEDQVLACAVITTYLTMHSGGHLEL